MLNLLSKVHKEGQTIVMVTHDARVASLADRLVSLFDGEIVDDGRIARRRTRTAGEVIDLR
ncbi:hypothetical protein GCM10020001_065590 [Nonomuraea salmonea]